MSLVGRASTSAYDSAVASLTVRSARVEDVAQMARVNVRCWQETYRGSERVGSKTTDVRLWPRGEGTALITYAPVARGESTLDFNAGVVNVAPGTCFKA